MPRIARNPTLAMIAVFLAVAFIGCAEEPVKSNGAAADFKPDLSSAPRELRALYAKPNALLGGGPPAFRRQLAQLKGIPIVINKWASWCGPCRAEWGHFQNQAKARGSEVAFLAVNSDDTRENAREFLDELPVPYPSFFDPRSKIAAELNAVIAFPATAFIGADGELEYVKQGQYSSEDDLARDIEQYALGKTGSNQSNN